MRSRRGGWATRSGISVGSAADIAAIDHEASFRLETYLLLILLPLAFYLGRNALERAILAAVAILVPTMELMNGALEAIVDKTTPEHHELAGRAKDMGSAAVSGCMLIVVVVWGAVALERFGGL